MFAAVAQVRSPVKKLFVKSYGCQMNVYDSSRMADVLAGEGYAETAQVEEADLIVLNTCHIREKAAEKVYSELGRLSVMKRERAEQDRGTTIVVAGCVAQAEGREIIRRAPAVDAVVGPQSYHRLPAILSRAAGQQGVVDTEFPAEAKFAHLPDASPERIRKRGVAAFLTVQEGCDKFCSFCVVPYTRGAEVSRPVAAILEEARRLVESGVREITLIGQNVNAYHGVGPDGRDWSLAWLVGHLGEILGSKGLARLRYTTSHPRDMASDLIAAHRDLPVLMPFLHLPLQSGSDRLLHAMNRRHRADDYRQLVEKIRSARPDIALSSDFIVGFPGETEAEFEETLRMAAEIRFASAFSFKYSPRPGTPAAEVEAQIPELVVADRLARLQAQLERDRQDFNTATVGCVIDLLIEKPGRYPGQLAGKSPYLQAVQVEGAEARIGNIIPVRITRTGSNSLFAEPAGASHAGQIRPLIAAA